MKDPEDVGEALVRLWPWLEAALDAFGPDSAAAEKICRLPRYGVRSAGKFAAKAVPMLATALPRRFDAAAHSCYLFVASELVKTFGDDPSADGNLEPMLTRLLTAACSGLTSLEAVSARPDVADDAFLLAGRALSYAPRLLITPQLLPSLLDAVQSGMLVQHREACLSISSFVFRLLDPLTLRKCPPEAAAHLQAAIAPRAPMLVRLALAGVCGALPMSRVHEMMQILFSVLNVARAQGLEWTSQALAAIPEESASVYDKQKFMGVCQLLLGGDLGVEYERELQNGLEDLSECVRRNRKAQAIAQRALLPAELQYIVRA